MVRSTVDNVVAPVVAPATGSGYPLFDYSDLLLLPAPAYDRPAPAVARPRRGTRRWKRGMLAAPTAPAAEIAPAIHLAHPDWLRGMRQAMRSYRMPDADRKGGLGTRSQEVSAP